jgi:DNA-binding transcriptional LysR family regulator
MKYPRIDPTLLAVFDAIMTERNVTRAARELGMTQPAVSNALNRLRVMLRDDLFRRRPDGMQPTPFAFELAPSVRRVLAGLEAILQPAEFVPERDTRTFRLSMIDSAAATILPRIYSLLHASAPGISLRMRPNTTTTELDILDNGQVDFIIGVLAEHPSRHKRHVLFKDQFVCAMRHEHQLAGGPLSLDAYLSARHAASLPSGEGISTIDRLLDARGLSRRVVLTINHILTAPMLVNNSDLLVTIPSRIAKHFQTIHGLHVADVPFPIDPYDVSMVWHERANNDAAHRWMRSRIIEVCSDL